jgi:hypothetical protein
MPDEFKATAAVEMTQFSVDGSSRRRSMPVSTSALITQGHMVPPSRRSASYSAADPDHATVRQEPADWFIGDDDFGVIVPATVPGAANLNRRRR